MERAEAVAISTRKWEALAEGKLPEDHTCGFCTYFEAESNEDCQECPLFPDICAQLDQYLEREPLFWTYSRANDTSVAKLILEAIKTRGKLWIEKEETKKL